MNDVTRWWENDPVLCTTYCLLALDMAYPWLEGAKVVEEVPAEPAAEKPAEAKQGPFLSAFPLPRQRAVPRCRNSLRKNG